MEVVRDPSEVAPTARPADQPAAPLHTAVGVTDGSDDGGLTPLPGQQRPAGVSLSDRLTGGA